MNYCEYEDRIALYIEGDLTAEEAFETERHLVTCPECAELAAGLRESQAALKSFANAMPGPRVRSRVLETLESRRSRMRWLAVAAAVFVLISAGLVWSVQRNVEAPQIAQLPPAPPAARQAEAPAPQPVRQAAALPKRSRRPVRRVPKPKPEPVQVAENTEPLVVKMLTDDPDVVIIWLVDGKEQQNEETTFGIDGPRGE